MGGISTPPLPRKGFIQSDTCPVGTHTQYKLQQNSVVMVAYVALWKQKCWCWKHLALILNISAPQVVCRVVETLGPHMKDPIPVLQFHCESQYSLFSDTKINFWNIFKHYLASYGLITFYRYISNAYLKWLCTSYTNLKYNTSIITKITPCSF